MSECIYLVFKWNYSRSGPTRPSERCHLIKVFRDPNRFDCEFSLSLLSAEIQQILACPSSFRFAETGRLLEFP